MQGCSREALSPAAGGWKGRMQGLFASCSSVGPPDGSSLSGELGVGGSEAAPALGQGGVAGLRPADGFHHPSPCSAEHRGHPVSEMGTLCHRGSPGRGKPCVLEYPRPSVPAAFSPTDKREDNSGEGPRRLRGGRGQRELQQHWRSWRWGEERRAAPDLTISAPALHTPPPPPPRVLAAAGAVQPALCNR